MKCGDVIFREDKPFVITEMIGSAITEAERLEDYVAKNTVIDHDGQQRTLFGVLHEYMAEYIYYNEIVKEEEKL